MSVIQQQMLDTIAAYRGRITAADAAARTGLALHEVTKELNRIASVSLAVLEVSQAGTIVYVFPPNVAKAFEAVGVKKYVDKIFSFAYSVAAFMIRSSFGILLIASSITLLIIFAITLLMIMFAADGADGHFDFNHHHHGGDLDFDFFDLENLFMFFTWWHHDVSDDDFTYLGKAVDMGDKGFLYNCFSFLFGDGNPNRKFRENSWQYIADMIRLNNGVITAEQVAPYLEASNRIEDRTMFPVLVRFDGVPEVTETGNIVYAFPSMQMSAQRMLIQQPPAFAEERQWKFTEVPLRRMDFVFFFAWANLAGWYAVSHNATILSWLQPYDKLAPAMLWYALFFISFPMLRELTNAVRNGFVDYRNNVRKRAAARLEEPQIQAKMVEAQQFAYRLQLLQPGQNVYTTQVDWLEQQFRV